MKILIDMNLSPEWVQEFKKYKGCTLVGVGKFDAADIVLMDWARKNEYVIFTHDLDFGTALALTKAEKPSVIQVRTQNVTIPHLHKMVMPILKAYDHLLEKGALIVLDEDKERVRILPL
jgi:predicted nuclease of predicted toxin-antitoxin system